LKNAFEKIISYNKDLLPDMLQFRYRQMSRDYYRFFRGSCHLFYEDLAGRSLPLSPNTWICGDLHMENFGTYKGDNRLVYFDINDFDEALLAPAAWEITHYLCSLFIAFDVLEIEPKKATNMARHYLKKYSETLSSGKSIYIEPQTATGIVKKFLDSVSKRSPNKLLKKRTNINEGKSTLLINEKKFFPLDKDLRKELISHLTDWILNQHGSPYNFEVKDVAFRKAGLGSLGLRRYVALLKSTSELEKYLLIDMKQARRSAGRPFTDNAQPDWKSEAERIVEIQKRMQNVSPALLSTTEFKNESYVIHELHPTRDNLNFSLIKHDYRNIYQAVNDMALITASSQLRSAGRQGSACADELIGFGKQTSWQPAVIEEAKQQARVVKQNYNSFCREFKNTNS
jgi:uncharacterized protein (DUF2252 family)